jgi:hypothetical protein
MTIGVEIGALALPAEPPEDGCATIADPALDMIGAFVAGVWRRYAGEAWSKIAPKEPIVRNVFKHDPEEYSFSENDLPALYLFRVGSARPPEQIAEDIRVRYENVRIFWVLPPAPQERQRQRSAIRSALAGALDSALERTRDPGWIATGDTDPLAASEGSSLINRASLMAIRLAEWATSQIAIAMKDDSPRRAYPCLSIRLELQEQVGPTFGDLAQAVELDLKVTVEGFQASHHITPITP